MSCLLSRWVIHPDKTAVVFGEQELSYQELYDKSHDLALYLQSMGVKPDSLVGLCVERSLDMVVGVLGILAAGGAYVPLDPDYPATVWLICCRTVRQELFSRKESYRAN